MYFGGLTFSPDNPANSLNKVAAKRIAVAVVEKYGLRDSLHVTLENLIRDGDIRGVLSCYRDLMLKRDAKFPKQTEEMHRDSFHFSLLQNHTLNPHPEFEVVKVSHCLVIA